MSKVMIGSKWTSIKTGCLYTVKSLVIVDGVGLMVKIIHDGVSPPFTSAWTYSEFLKYCEPVQTIAQEPNKVKAGTNWVSFDGRMAHVTFVGRHALQFEYIGDHDELCDSLDGFLMEHKPWQVPTIHVDLGRQDKSICSIKVMGDGRSLAERLKRTLEKANKEVSQWTSIQQY